MQYDGDSCQGSGVRDQGPGAGVSRPLAAVLCVLALFVTAGNSWSLEALKKPKDYVKATASATKIDDSGNQTVTITMTIEKGWYIYANPVNNDEFKNIQTLINVKAQKDLVNVKIQYPAGKTHEDKDVGNYSVYEDKVTIPVIVQRTAGDVSPLEVEVIFNTCNVKGVCLRKDSYTFTLP